MANQNKEVVNKKNPEQLSVNERFQEIYPNLSPNESKNLEQNTIKLQTLRKKLEIHLKNPGKLNEEIVKLQEEIFAQEREKVRLIQFYALKYKGNDKQKTIIGKNENPETVRASDLLFLKKTGADLAKLLLVKKGDATKEVSKDKVEEKDEFIVNFGNNQNVNNIIGAGDILGVEVREVEINGKKGFRKSSPRPGYYTEAGKYLPVYDGDNIKILKKGNIKADEISESEKAEDTWFRKNRINDLASEESNINPELQEDIDIINEVKAEKERRKKFIEQFGNASNGKDSIEFNKFRIGDNDFKEISNNVGLSESEIPVIQSIMASVGKQESGSNYAIFGVELDSGTHNGDRALGRYQIMPKNWIAWSNKFFGKTLEYTPENQDKIAFAQMSAYFMKYKNKNPDLSYIIGEISQDWYGRGKAPSGFPSTEQYAQSVISIYNKNYKGNIAA